jgi:hypothetical protein
MYPAFHITKLIISDKFWDGKFKVVSWNPYGATIKDTNTDKIYKIAW